MRDSKRISEDIWRSLPDECKEIMGNVKTPFQEWIESEIEYVVKKYDLYHSVINWRYLPFITLLIGLAIGLFIF